MIRKSVFLKKMPQLVLALAVLMLAGCATAPPKPEVRYLFPPLPEEPHMEFLNVYYSQDDFPKTDSQKAAETIIGKPPLDFFKMPNSIASDSKGRVYVSEPTDSSIVVFDFVTNKRSLLLEGDNAELMTAPHGLAVDSRDNLYAVDNEQKKVMVFSPEGSPLLVFGGPDVFERPSFLALNERLGRIYVSDGQKSQVVVFDFSGRHLFSFGGSGAAEGQLFGPAGIAVANDDSVFVAEQLNTRIQRFDANGKSLGMFGTRGDQYYNLEGPRGLAFDSDQNLHVLDMRQAKLKIYRPDGTLLMFVGAGGKSLHPMGFTFPNGIWIDRNDRVYVVDSFNKRFSVWQYFSEKHLAGDPFGIRKNLVK